MAHNPEIDGYKTNHTNTSAAKYHSTSELSSALQPTTTACQSSPPTVYGELSILGYNGYIPNTERHGRRNRSKFLLCKRTAPNGIKKSRHYIVKQPQATEAIQDKDLHSISYTFSRSQTIIVEYRQDDNTDMFQIGRSSEDPIDFVVMDTFSTTNLMENSSHSSSNNHPSSGRHHSSHHHNYNENNSNNPRQLVMVNGGNDISGMSRLHRHLAKVGEDLLHYGPPPPAHDHRHRVNYHRHHPVLLNYPQPNISNLPPMMANQLRNQDSSFYHQHSNHGHSSGNSQHLQPSYRSNGDHINLNGNNQPHHESRPDNVHKRSHATQSTISRFACRILVDRTPPYTARIYAAGFDSSKNIFLGEKATKWKQDSTIDGLTTNGVLLMHPKQGSFYESSDELRQDDSKRMGYSKLDTDHNINSGDMTNGLDSNRSEQMSTSNEMTESDITHVGSSTLGTNHNNNNTNNQVNNDSSEQSKSKSSTCRSDSSAEKLESSIRNNNDSNNNNNVSDITMRNQANVRKEIGGVWREVSVDGGIYEIRESRSATQKGTRIESENNILQDGTLIDLCGATLLWRSVDGFKATPSKKSLEEKIDLLNASRPQCPVGLNTLVIPRKPIIPSNHSHRKNQPSKDGHHTREHDRNSHQPYVYLKCGHVQGYHDWGAIDKSNQRTCPICLSVGGVAKLSMGLEPSFYVDSGPLTHVFNPCGHMASKKTVKYWCSIEIPHGTHFFHSICPFCATPLATNEPASARLIFQDDLD